MLLYKAVDGGLEIYDGMKDAVFQPAPCELGEKALDGIEPCARRRDEVEGPTRMPGQPGADLRLLVGRIIVEDDVAGLVSGHLGFDRVQEPDELLMPVPLHVARSAEHRSELQYLMRNSY